MPVYAPLISRWLMFLIGLSIMLAAILTGNSIQSELAAVGGEAYMQTHGIKAILQFILFAFGYPLGLVVAILSVLQGADKGGRSALVIGLSGLAAVTAAAVIPPLLGRGMSAVFFGGGGYVMTALILLSVWLWGRYRSRLPVSRHAAADLQGIGYLCFAVAVWNLCGVGTMPSFALDPARMLALGTQPFAVGQMKAIMVLFIAGWLFTAWGYFLAGRDDRAV